MRTICLASALVAGLAVVGCGDGAQHGGGVADLAIPDMTARDLSIPTACSPTDPMSDGTPCAAGCPAGTIGVNLDGACKCYLTCTVDPECSCDRFCDPVTRPDAGVVSGACLLGNAPGERCGVDGAGAPIFGNRFCAQLTMCINADA
ncbi:MAG TPA: hypothetical protein VF997_18365, partial [Polyangia bacterium]